jgi:hypothetical protein
MGGGCFLGARRVRRDIWVEVREGTVEAKGCFELRLKKSRRGFKKFCFVFKNEIRRSYWRNKVDVKRVAEAGSSEACVKRKTEWNCEYSLK